jgi:hypothetical protein
MLLWAVWLGEFSEQGSMIRANVGALIFTPIFGAESPVQMSQLF